MIDLTVIGPAAATLEYSKPVYSTNEGLFWEQKWWGTRTAIDALVNSLNLDSDESFNYDESRLPMWGVLIRTPDYRNGLSSALNKWEVVHNKSEISLKEAPGAIGISAADMYAIDQLLKNPSKFAIAGPTGPPPAGVTWITFASTDAAILYSHMLRGQNKQPDIERVFRYSVLTSKRWASLLTEANTLRLYSTASLLNPSASGLIIPVQTQYKLQAVQAWATSARPNVTVTCEVGGGTTTTESFTWAWMKQPADTEQLPSGKLRHTQEFWGYRWSTWQFGSVL